MLSSRFISFHSSLLESSKFLVRFLARMFESDLRTVHGKNLEEIRQLCNIDRGEQHVLRPNLVKKNLRYFKLSADEHWRLDLCKELLNLRDTDDINLPGFNDEDLNSLLTYVCVS